MGLKPVSLRDTAMGSVAIAAQGRVNPNTCVPHHCTAQRCQRSQRRANWRSAKWKDALIWLGKSSVAVQGKRMHNQTTYQSSREFLHASYLPFAAQAYLYQLFVSYIYISYLSVIYQLYHLF